ncbi:MAG: hypothetical protein FWH57_13715 [Oscillospiraceae bacterium]|nr:hypothetical protein [Oscillospiraceae bacterium]
MAMLTVADIQIQGALAVDMLLEFSLSAKVNEHVRLRYAGEISAETGAKILEKVNRQDLVTVMLCGEVAFVGQPVSIAVSEKNSFFTLTVECNSTSYLMDVEEHCRSFQQPDMTYAEVVRAICSKSEDQSVITVQDQHVSIGRPIIQYKETDWQFILRMASHLETLVVPNPRSASSQIAFGAPKGKHYAIDATGCRVGRFRKKCNDGEWRDFLNYTFEHETYFDLGDTVSFSGREWLVVEQSVALIGGLLHNTCTLGEEQAYALRRLYPDKLCGLSLLGTVIDTNDENVRLHLDIDQSQEKEKAFWFPFAPQQGTVMYCMPQIGAKAMLSINSRDEGNCVVEHCYRTNGQDCADMNDHNHRYFTTEFGKRMAMLPGLASFDAGGSEVSLRDDVGIGVSTGKTMQMYAQGQIRFGAHGRVLFQTPEQLMLAKTGQESGIEVSGGQLHTRSKKVYVKGDADKQAPPLRESGQKNVKMPLDLALTLSAFTPIVLDTKNLK